MNNGKRNKIAIIGAGFVGASTAFALLTRGIASELVIIDQNEGKAEGEAMDLMHGLPFVRPVKISAGDYSNVEGADIVIITAGANQKPGETRIDLVNKNVAIFKDIIPKVLQHNRDGILLVVTNPVDILTYATYKISGLPKHRVIGSGTVLDTSRFRTILANHVGIDARNIHGYILGEHGDTEVAAWSATNIAGMPMDLYCKKCGECREGEQLNDIVNEVKNAAYKIIEKKGATYYAVALAITRIVEAILRDEKSILTVSSFMEGELGFSDVALSLPTVVGLSGIERVLDIPLNPEELSKLKESAEALQKVIKTLNFG